MARNFSVSEVVDLVCKDFSENKREEEGGEEVYSYRRGAILQADELESLAKAGTFLIGDNGSNFVLKATRTLKRAKTLPAALRRRWNLMFQVRIYG